ncbi:MAG: hypothetical protein IPP94_10775 [Ignavibacteria bacterium]|nr:hypothetical protein [Ignavibacteria bacterium]
MNAYQSTLQSASGDPFIAKFNGAGTLLWSTYASMLGGYEWFNDITTDPGGNVIAVGKAWGAMGEGPGLVFKMSAGGGFRWFRYFDGFQMHGSFANGVATDGSGNIFVVGGTTMIIIFL